MPYLDALPTDLGDALALVRDAARALISAFPSDPAKVPPTYKYFLEIVDILKNMKPESLTSKSVLVGPNAIKMLNQCACIKGIRC